MAFREFTYNEQQAAITAKWQLGVRNYTYPMAIAPFVLIFFYQLLSYIGLWGLPLLALNIYQLSAAALYLMLVLYVLYRIHTLAAALRRYTMAICFTGDSVAVKTGDEKTFLIRYVDIARVDCGQQIVRFAGKYGAWCVPRDLTPDSFLADMRKRADIQFHEPRWM